MVQSKGVFMANGRGNRFYTYLNKKELSLVQKYAYEKFGLTDIDSATARIIVMRLLKDAGYSLPEPV